MSVDLPDGSPTTARGPLSRRALLATGGAATASAALVISGCSTYSSELTAQASGNSAQGGSHNAETGGGNGASPAALGPVSSIPVGGGRVFPEQQVVVTQPTPGTFKAFSSVCTHAGCHVDSVTDGSINCPCHNSKFNINDGSPTKGPAKKPLAARKVSTEGDTLRVS